MSGFCHRLLHWTLRGGSLWPEQRRIPYQRPHAMHPAVPRAPRPAPTPRGLRTPRPSTASFGRMMRSSPPKHHCIPLLGTRWRLPHLLRFRPPGAPRFDTGQLASELLGAPSCRGARFNPGFARAHPVTATAAPRPLPERTTTWLLIAPVAAVTQRHRPRPAPWYGFTSTASSSRSVTAQTLRPLPDSTATWPRRRCARFGPDRQLPAPSFSSTAARYS